MRKPSVAWMFYPDDSQELGKMVDSLLQNAPDYDIKWTLKWLILPHAGYPFSWLTAAAGYKILQKFNYKKILLVGPSHHFYFNHAAYTDEDFETPLGIVKTWKNPDFLDNHFVSNIPKAHEKEHSLEVQLPFLQKIYKDFEIFPLALSDVDYEKLADIIFDWMDKDTFVLVSSDLSHFYSYDKAFELDKKSIKRILNLEESEEINACGREWIFVMVNLAKKLGWSPFFIDYKNSWDIIQDRSSVVGYTSIWFEQ